MSVVPLLRNLALGHNIRGFIEVVGALYFVRIINS
jgi:hypothetical protein